MRLLSIINNPVFGGGHVQMARLREPLAARGIETIGVTPEGASAAPRLRDAGVEVVEVPLHRLRATPDPRVQAPFLAAIGPEVAGLRRLIRDRGIDVVQVHGDTNPHGALAARAEGVGVVWQLYDTRTPPPLRRLTMPLVTRLAGAITTWGEELGRVHPGTERLGDRWIPVFPPVSETDFGPVEPDARAAARRELGIPFGAPAIGVIGNRNPSKGHEVFVRALAEVRRTQRDAAGRILGAPSPAHAAYEAAFRADAERLGLDATAFDVRDGGTRIPELLPAFDLLALTSVPRSEGMPTVILEAMACALPVVATDVGAVRELVEDGVTGIVVPPQDPTAIAAAITRVVGDPALRTRLGRAGRQRFEQRFSLDALADLHAKAYAVAVQRRGGGAAKRRA